MADKFLLLCLRDGLLQPGYSQGIFGPNINYSFTGADDVGGYQHALQQIVRVAFDHSPVHEGPGIAFVGVTNKIFFVASALVGGLPFEPGRESGATAAGQSRYLDLLYNLFGGHARKHFFEGSVTIFFDIVVHLGGVDKPAVPQCYPCLFFQEQFVPIGDTKWFQLREITVSSRFQYIVRLFHWHFHQSAYKFLLFVNIHYRLKETHSDASGDSQVDVVALPHPGQYGIVHLSGTGGYTATSLSNHYLHSASSLAFFLSSRIIAATLSLVSVPYVSSLIIIAGERLQQPKHATFFSVKSPSAVVSPSFMPKISSIAFSILSLPLTWHAVPWQSIIRYLPMGCNLN